MNPELRDRRAYIAGPMTGIPDFNYPAFNAAAAFFRAEGYHVENPAENAIDPTITDNFDKWQAYMRASIAQLITCDIVVVLPGWSTSEGASLEVHIARKLRLPVYDERVLRATFTSHPDDPEENAQEATV